MKVGANFARLLKRMPHYRALNPIPALRATLALLASLALACGLLAVSSVSAHAAVSCPNSNPIVNENNCMGAGTTANQIDSDNYSDNIGGYPTATSFNLGQSVPLKIGTNLSSFPGAKVNIAVYRIGYYGGTGARLIPAAGANNVAINNNYTCGAVNTTTGEQSCANWNVSYTIPGSALPVSGIYEAVFTDVADGGIQNYVVFPVRNDARASNVLYVLPTATYEAYNTWTCKSLYYDACGGADTISGDDRAVAVSFDRPLDNGDIQRNRFFGPDDAMVQWVEEQGYDVTYTDDLQTDMNASSLLNHKIDLISGHSEYWSAASFNNFLAARNAGVNIASFSSNTAYWQTRYTDNYRTLVCYKTIQGSSDGNAAATPNDPASLGPDGIPHTADDVPSLATTTRRDPGAPAGDPNAPPGGRIGPNQPENQLFGNMYIGDNDDDDYGLTIPAGNTGGEFAGSRVWRNAGLPASGSTTLGPNLVGWEWDQIPTQPGYLAVEPAGVKRVTLTDVTNPDDSFIQDAGRARAATPPAGEPSNVSAVEYRATSGALVFASGTMQWSYGLDSGTILNQATYNIFSDMGVQPGTPESGIVLDPPNAVQPPNASFTATPTTVLTRPERGVRRLRLDRQRRHDHRLQVGPRRQRQLRHRHRHHQDADALVQHARHLQRRAEGHRLQRPDRRHYPHGDGQQPADGQPRDQPEPGRDQPEADARRLRLGRPERHDHRLQVGPRRQRHVRDRHRRHADRHDLVRDHRHAHAGRQADRQPRRHPDDHRQRQHRRHRRQPLQRRRARHARAAALLPARRGHRPDDPRLVRRRRRHADRRDVRQARRGQRRPRHVGQLRGQRRPDRRPGRQLRHGPARSLQPADDHRRVLVEVGPVRQQRRTGDGVHGELQQHRRRLPGRPQRR